MTTTRQPTQAEVEAAIKQAEAEHAAHEKASDVLAEIDTPAPTLGGVTIAPLSWARKMIVARAMDTIKARRKNDAGEDEPDISDEDAAMMTLFVMASDGWTAKAIVDRKGGDGLLREAFDLADRSAPDEYDRAMMYAGMKMNALAAAANVSGTVAHGPGKQDETSAEKNALT
jgi:hypothetical protein